MGFRKAPYLALLIILVLGGLGIFFQVSGNEGRDTVTSCYVPARVHEGGHLWFAGPVLTSMWSTFSIEGWHEYTCRNGRWVSGG